MVRCSKLSIALSAFFLIFLISQSAFSSTAPLFCYSRAQQTEQDQGKKDKKEKKRARRDEEKTSKQKEPEEREGADAKAAASSEEEVELVSDSQSVAGDVVLCEGYVNATQGD